MLKNLDQWLQAGAAHAQKKNFDVDVLARARLAPDQYALVQQIQSACDTARSSGSRAVTREQVIVARSR